MPSDSATNDQYTDPRRKPEKIVVKLRQVYALIGLSQWVAAAFRSTSGLTDFLVQGI